uniref:7TM_GPCR_Srx domain-containing protein n=1 Tax=Heterorhabditis bacteriophora TaxID=37862 RepID=A0A1I7WSK6_HETBA
MTILIFELIFAKKILGIITIKIIGRNRSTLNNINFISMLLVLHFNFFMINYII